MLARQRELSALEHRIDGAREAAINARNALASVELEQDGAQKRYHAESLAFSSQQRRCHDLELELMQLKQAEPKPRRSAASRSLPNSPKSRRKTAAERAQGEALTRELADAQLELHDEMAKRDAARHAHNESEVEFARGRERVRGAERAAQEAAFAERSCRERLADLERRRESLTAQVTQQRDLLQQLTSERAAIDWSPVEDALQRQLGARGEAEQALAAARDRQEGLAAELRAADEARLAAQQQQSSRHGRRSRRCG